MTDVLDTIEVSRAFGPMVEGEALVSAEGFSPRYDLDRWQRDWYVMQMLPGSHQLGC